MATQPVVNPAPAQTGGANATSQTLHRLERETALASFVAAVQAVLPELASWVLDHVPNAHQFSANRLAKLLPLAAIVFRVSTPPGTLLDNLDELVQDLSQALRREAQQRTAAAAAATNAAATAIPNVTPPPLPPAPAEEQYARLLFAVIQMPQQQMDDLLVWHDALNQDDKDRLYNLVSHATDTQLEALVRQRVSALQAAIAQVQLPAAPVSQSWLQFRHEAAADPTLAGHIGIFLAAKPVGQVAFWKAVEQAYGTRIKDQVDFQRLMSMSPDEIEGFLSLAPVAQTPSPFAALNAAVVSSGLEANSVKLLDWAQQFARDSWK